MAFHQFHAVPQVVDGLNQESSHAIMAFFHTPPLFTPSALQVNPNGCDG